MLQYYTKVFANCTPYPPLGNITSHGAIKVFYTAEPGVKMIFIPCVEMFGPKVELVNIFFCELSNKYQVRMADLESNGAKINITNRGERVDDFNTNQILESVVRMLTMVRYVKNAPMGPRLYRGCREGASINISKVMSWN